jgi:transcription elongation GreA/GreB family factor
MDKQLVYTALFNELNSRLVRLNNLLMEAMQSTSGETKSSAGDKHETSRAMAHLEQEKIGRQLYEMKKLREIALRIDPLKKSNTIELGSLLETTKGWFYLSVGIGSLEINEITVFCMTPSAPLGKLLLGKKPEDTFTWQEDILEILAVY